jgi:crossover junction endodeoxyribonuclease RuvC
LLVLGIDPGSITTGWALIESVGNKVRYVDSGVLRFDAKTDFLQRLAEIQSKTQLMIEKLSPDEIALESLIYVKSPTALSKLAQTRGVILSTFIQNYQHKTYEYSPNLVKSTAVGHGHADKESVQKFLDMLLGKRDYQTHDESDAVAIALCHILNKDKVETKMPKKASGKGLAASLAHRIK